MTKRTYDQAQSFLRDQFGKVASGCAPGGCGPAASLALGYSADDLAATPEGANMGLGCVNPQAIAALRAGETVLDLGSGGGFDCFLAAKQVGPSGHVIGVDMTPEMVSRARANARTVAADVVEFRLGEIEHLPVADASVDVVLSNCVINVSPKKAAVFAEAFRVLRPGGRLAISDLVTLAQIPEETSETIGGILGLCVAEATSIEALEQLLTSAGFESVSVDRRPESRAFIREWAPGSRVEEYLSSASITATKPRTTRA